MNFKERLIKKIRLFIYGVDNATEINANYKLQRQRAIFTLLYLIPILILTLTVLFTIYFYLTKDKTPDSVSDKLYTEYANEDSFKERVYGEDQNINKENDPTPENEQIAISVFGDSFCLPANARVASFPAYLSKYTNMTLVYNVASPSDTIITMAAREGGVPMYISPCDIPKKKRSVEITLDNEYGEEIAFDLSKNAGLNPCTVNGVEGVLFERNDSLYFSRTSSGSETIITQPTIVETRAMKYRLSDITVFFVGNDKMYNNPKQLVEYYKKMVDNLKTDKYLIIGPVQGNKNELTEGNKALADAFGDKFLNVYDYLCGKAITDYKLKLDANSKEKVANKSGLPDVYLDKNTSTYFNMKANDIVGKFVADKLYKLKYIKK